MTAAEYVRDQRTLRCMTAEENGTGVVVNGGFFAFCLEHDVVPDISEWREARRNV